MPDSTKELCELLDDAIPYVVQDDNEQPRTGYGDRLGKACIEMLARLRSEGPDGLRVVPKSLNYSSIHDIASDLWEYLRNFLKHDAPEDQLFYEIERAILRAGGERAD